MPIAGCEEVIDKGAVLPITGHLNWNMLFEQSVNLRIFYA